MSKKRGSEKRAKADALYVRMDPDLAESLRRAAASRSISSAELARIVLATELGRKSRIPRPIDADPDLLRRLAEIGTHLGRQTGALIQFAKAIREGRVSPELKQRAEGALSAAKATQARVLAELGLLSK